MHDRQYPPEPEEPALVALPAPLEPTVDSVALRRDKERQKAVEKYGEIALAPDGHPDYDVLDYAINEVVGMVRYAEMVSQRVYRVAGSGPLASIAGNIGREMHTFGYQVGSELIELRRLLLERGYTLGKEEVR